MPLRRSEPPPEVIAAPIDTLQTPPGHFAADGFPIDLRLRSWARRAAVGYGLLALYYVTVMPNVLRGVRWNTLALLAQDLAIRSELVLGIMGYIAADVILGICAWRVLSMVRWASWAVTAMGMILAAWVLIRSLVSVWAAISAPLGQPSLMNMAVTLVLTIGYALCAVMLWHAVASFNRQRAQALSQFQGRISN